MRAHRPTLVLVALLLTVTSAAAQSSRPSPPREPRKPSASAALNAAVKELTREARAAAREGTLPRARADFARGFEHDIPPEAVLRKLVRPVSRDAFIDGYVRWQLTSFRPTLDGMEPRTLEQMMSRLPKMGENPRANAELLDTITRLRRVSPLEASDKKAISEALDRLGERVSRARELNVPGLQFRAWLAGQLEADRLRGLELSLERLAAHVAAGWSIDRLKPPLEKQFEAGRWDDDFTTEQRQRIAAGARRLVGVKRAVLASARIVEDQLEVEFDETAVYDYDVRRWLKSIERE